MAWRTIAKKDARAVADSQLFRYFLVLVAFAFVLGGYLLPTVTEDPTMGDFPGYMDTSITLLLPLLGIMLGYKSIVGERASGRMGLLLSLPHSRRDVVIGKLVGRGFWLVLAVTVGIGVGGWLVYYPFGTLEPGVLLAYLLVTLLFGLSFVGIALAISTLTTSEHVATGGAFGSFFLLVVVWPELRPLLVVGLEQVGLADGSLPNWALFVYGLAPGLSYERVLAGFFTDSPDGPFFAADAPWYLGEWAALLVLVGWTIVPIAIGYRRFEGTDL